MDEISSMHLKCILLQNSKNKFKFLYKKDDLNCNHSSYFSCIYDQ